MTRITDVGHATVQLEAGGTRLDPILRRDGMRTLAGGGCGAASIWGWGGWVGLVTGPGTRGACRCPSRAPWLDDPARPARAFARQTAALADAVEVRVVPPGGSTDVRAAGG
jgi:hypothetical protein